MNAPGSPSSPLQMMYFVSELARRTWSHLACVGNPAPPRPRRPLRRIWSMICSGASSVRQVRCAAKPSCRWYSSRSNGFRCPQYSVAKCF